MAYVAISAGLLSDINTHIRNLRHAELETCRAPDVTANDINYEDNFIQEKIWLGRQDLKAVLPEEWKRSIDKIDLRFKMNGSTFLVASLNGGPFLLPPVINTSGYRPDVYVHIRDENELTQAPPVVQRAYALESQRKVIEQRWSEVKENLQAFLQKCKSLNEAIKLWPGVALYIPQKYQDRLEEKRERNPSTNEAREKLKTINTDAIEAAAVIARLSTN
jgi:hypothetical protein